MCACASAILRRNSSSGTARPSGPVGGSPPGGSAGSTTRRVSSPAASAVETTGSSAATTTSWPAARSAHGNGTIGRRWLGTKAFNRIRMPTPESVLGCRSVVQQRDGPRPTGPGARHLHREAGDPEPVRRQRFEVAQPLDLAFLAIAPGEVGRPQHAAVAGLPVPRDDVAERGIEAERVRTDDPYPEVEQEVRGGGVEPGEVGEVPGGTQMPLGAGLQDRDVQRLRLVPHVGPRLGPPGRGHGAPRSGGEVGYETRGPEPLQGGLVDQAAGP